MQRDLYLVAYDVRHPSRLRRALTVLKNYASGGQKSAFECFLTANERKELIGRVTAQIDVDLDALLVVRLTSRRAANALGVGVAPSDELYTYIG